MSSAVMMILCTFILGNSLSEAGARILANEETDIK